MPAYQYTTAAISHGLMGRKSDEVDREELGRVLNEHGAEGWELVGITSNNFAYLAQTCTPEWRLVLNTGIQTDTMPRTEKWRSR